MPKKTVVASNPEKAKEMEKDARDAKQKAEEEIRKNLLENESTRKLLTEGQEVVFFENHENEEVKIGADKKVKPTVTLSIRNCKNSTFHLNAMVTKLLIDHCENCTFFVNKKIITSFVEFWNCNQLKIEVSSPLKTIQIDKAEGMDFMFKKKEHFRFLFWAYSEKISLAFGDNEQSMKTGFTEMLTEHPNLGDVDQFRIMFLKDELIQEPVERLPNGFISTRRETLEFERREEEAMQKMAKLAGITISRKTNEDGEIEKRKEPNKPCDCGSGKKYKKCCGALVNKGLDYDPQAVRENTKFTAEHRAPNKNKTEKEALLEDLEQMGVTQTEQKEE
eukprot:GCRY01001755.1.p1 GENE.GCRY01001755.1~~GCRY01001755.1.p1  ORF type:complete len:334 (+),score=67.31 GCRY01001755.1:167-1168(+)